MKGRQGKEEDAANNGKVGLVVTNKEWRSSLDGKKVSVVSFLVLICFLFSFSKNETMIMKRNETTTRTKKLQTPAVEKYLDGPHLVLQNEDDWLDEVCLAVTECPKWRKAYDGVLLVMFVKFLPNLRHLEFFKKVYAPFEIVFYSDANDCDPKAFPCTGNAVNQSSYPAEVRWIPELGGGWYMQKTLLHAIGESAGRHSGYLFIADDAIVRFSDLTETAPLSSVWAAPLKGAFDLGYITRTKDLPWSQRKADSIARIGDIHAFYNATDSRYRAQMAQNIGRKRSNDTTGDYEELKSDVFVTSTNYDFVYIPSRFAQEWLTICKQMTDFKLAFTMCYATGWLGVIDVASQSLEFTSSGNLNKKPASSEDVVFLGTSYAGQNSSPRKYLNQLALNNSVSRVIHPFKLSDPKRRSALCDYLNAAAARDCPELNS